MLDDDEHACRQVLYMLRCVIRRLATVRRMLPLNFTIDPIGKRDARPFIALLQPPLLELASAVTLATVNRIATPLPVEVVEFVAVGHVALKTTIVQTATVKVLLYHSAKHLLGSDPSNRTPGERMKNSGTRKCTGC